MSEARKPTLKVGTDFVPVEVTSEPYVVMTMRGYAAVIDVKAPAGEHALFIGSKSISEGIEPLREANGGKFAGLRLRLKKAGDDKMAPWVVEKQ